MEGESKRIGHGEGRNRSNIDIFENKFEFIAAAAQRARDLRDGKKRLVEGVSEKEPLIALAELLSGKLHVEITRKRDDQQPDIK